MLTPTLVSNIFYNEDKAVSFISDPKNLVGR